MRKIKNENAGFLPRIPNSPCFECAKRHVNCHSTCEDYLEFRKRQDKENYLKRKKTYYDRLT